MSAPPGAASQVGKPPPVPSLNDILRHSHATVFAVLSAATSRVLYLSSNAGAVFDIEAKAVRLSNGAQCCAALQTLPFACRARRLLASLSGSALHAADMSSAMTALARARAAGADATPECIAARRR